MRRGAAWTRLVGIGLIIAAWGCRTPTPELKPAPIVEALNSPPAEKRYDSPDYPKAAFNNRNTPKKLDQDPTVMPVRGPGAGMGGGMPTSPTGYR